MKAYEETIRETAAPHAPWYVVPADNKWFTRIVVAAAVIETLDSLGLAYPKVGKKQREELEGLRQAFV
jgi:polyphosphate kinase 2 (PPK2 family)